MYLETILVLSGKSDTVRSVDVGEYMGFSKPSVSRAIGVLKREGYVIMEDSGRLLLTDEGARIAKRVYERHTMLSEYLMQIGVSDETAVSDACRIEHVISDETFECLKKHTQRG